MSAWCMAHPWMTFLLIGFTIGCATEAVGKFARRK